MMVSDREKRFLDGLLSRVPEFKEKYLEHLEFNEELLPMVVMDEFSRFLLEEFRRAMASPGGASEDVVTRALNYLESALSERDESVDTLIRTTFSESVDAEWRDKDLLQALLPRLGPNLRTTVSISNR